MAVQHDDNTPRIGLSGAQEERHHSFEGSALETWRPLSPSISQLLILRKWPCEAGLAAQGAHIGIDPFVGKERARPTRSLLVQRDGTNVALLDGKARAATVYSRVSHAPFELLFIADGINRVLSKDHVPLDVRVWLELQVPREARAIVQAGLSLTAETDGSLSVAQSFKTQLSLATSKAVAVNDAQKVMHCDTAVTSAIAEELSGLMNKVGLRINKVSCSAYPNLPESRF